MTSERFDELRANAESDADLVSRADVIECLDEIARLASEVYSPGEWYCPKCGFSLICQVIYTQSGNVGIDHREPETCLNDGTKMLPVTWKRAAMQMAERMPEANCMSFINYLRRSEGSSVSICCDNADYNGLPNCCIEVTDDWTEWEPKQFRADSLIQALGEACRARDAWNKKEGNPQ